MSRYRTLVSNDSVPFWDRVSIEYLAIVTDLYSLLSSNGIDDEYERWINTEIEEPASDVIDRIKDGKHLSSDDVESIVRFAAFQDIRTPKNFLDQRANWKKWLPNIAGELMLELDAMIQSGTGPPNDNSGKAKRYQDSISCKITPGKAAEHSETKIEISADFDRQAWLEHLHHIFVLIEQIALKHRWSIVRAAPNISWITSDHPVIRLNYYGTSRWDFQGGWDRNRGNIIMPLTPDFLLITEIGKNSVSLASLDYWKCLEINQIIAESAHRHIVAIRPIHRIKRIRPRVVNPGQYRSEQAFWDSWNLQDNCRTNSESE